MPTFDLWYNLVYNFHLKVQKERKILKNQSELCTPKNKL
ncbi:protein of unknown function [Candidatus Nitrosocosmicus franklandus]|uniref:Uncharacterized protein n=1 Tax=Candidatus Nitrosocosmicus franklandianus TaxID=1798806 RepID=A0A484IAB5_9ARCH|nr:protein of unknown function [Candidatus Nitrosocosmicus franklandus]